MDAVEAGLMRTLCFYDAMGYAPTQVELFAGFDVGRGDQGWTPAGVYPERSRGAGMTEKFEGLKNEHRLVESGGRVVFPGREALVAEHEKREGFLPRKLRRARRVAGWLARLSGVRFVALCNTTALAHARDEGDLDFFVVTRAGSIWQTRGWAALPFKFFGGRPRPGQEVRDAVCLSFFVDDAALDLTSLQLTEASDASVCNDPYFRHWFLSLLPLVDDGVSSSLWQANASITARHPLARPWMVSPDRERSHPALRVPSIPWLDAAAGRWQRRAFSPAIQSVLNRDTCVVVSGHVLKFHVEDGREQFREAYRQTCQRYGLEP